MPNNETTTTFYGGGQDAVYDMFYPENNETTMARGEALGATTALASGVLLFNYFVPRRTRTVTGAAFYSSTTAAGATPTLVRYGLYEVDGSGNLTLRASTANDTALFAAADTRYFKAYSASWQIKSGRTYASAVIVVTGAAAPTLLGLPAVAAGFDTVVASVFSQAPRRSSNFPAQTDLVASVTVAQAASFTALPIVAYSDVGTA